MSTCDRRHRWRARLFICLLAGIAAAQSHADAGWFASGDTQLRLDLQLLNDAEVIRLPISYWPLPRAAVQFALTHAKEHFATNAAVAAALQRVRARAAEPAQHVAYDTGVRGGQPGLWRDFDTLAREDGELAAGLDYDSGRYSLGLEVTAVTHPADGEEIRLDGTQATVQLGNWLLSANELDRWWGPGHEGSLILSNNARPMPTLMVERAAAMPFESSWLSWLGPWRLSFGVSRMESQREDIDGPLFMAWRVVIMPTKKMEIGFSRTAQFCGQQLKCDLTVVKDMLIGHDNAGLNVSAADQPGNQMAGFDLRWNSPLGNLPYALYGQYIGEDQSHYVPTKFLSQLGMEIWHPIADGGLVQGFLEYASTTCGGVHHGIRSYDCAYNQGQFNVEGYRYRGRSIGYTADRDAANWALGGTYTAMNGDLWSATLRDSRLDQHSMDDVRNTVASVPTKYDAFELGWKGRMIGEQFSIDLGVESIDPVNAGRDVHLYGFVGWRHQFQP